MALVSVGETIQPRPIQLDVPAEMVAFLFSPE
jgi:hypothetical protein